MSNRLHFAADTNTIDLLVHPYGDLQRDECILCYTMFQVTTGAIANLSIRISQLWYICHYNSKRLNSPSTYFLNLKPH